MTWNIALLVIALLQQPAPVARVTVGLLDGRQLTLAGGEFSGFIEGPFADAVLIYRQHAVHGEMPVKNISRIDFGPYAKGKPFAMTVTLKTGEKLEVESERKNFLTLAGLTDMGFVRIKHPEPSFAPLHVSTKRPNRKNDLTIQYLEFPTS